jgi:hypothetical protein
MQATEEDARRMEKGKRLSAAERRMEKEKRAVAMAELNRTRPKAQMREAWRSSGIYPMLPDVRAWIDHRQPAHYGADLDAYADGILSQHGEDGITYELLKRVGVTTRRCVELGCGHNGGNAGFLMAGLDYSGLWVDGDPELVAIATATFAGFPVTVKSAWITRETVNKLVEDEGFTGEIDYLGIDIDGIDWWLWEALVAVRPRLVIVEYNALFGPDVSVTVPYAADFSRKERNEQGGLRWPKGYFGASLRAFERLGKRLGYRLVAVAPMSSNAYFVREGLASGTPTLATEQAFVAPTKLRHISIATRVADLGGVLAWAERAGVALVEVP